MTKRDDKSIEAARRSFNDELLSPDYPSIHHHDSQIDRMVGFLAPRPGGTYLDLATGIGAMAFAIAGHQPKAQVFGIDIADQAISRNREVAREEAVTNLEFRLANGRTIDFPDATFDGISCRYALHHFPEVDITLANVRRVLKPGGEFAVADAIRHPGDEGDFINAFQALKPDGHVRIYGATDLVELFGRHGFEAQAEFGSTITFCRELNEDYRNLIAATRPDVLTNYGVGVDDEQVTITFEILTLRFVPIGG